MLTNTGASVSWIFRIVLKAQSQESDEIIFYEQCRASSVFKGSEACYRKWSFKLIVCVAQLMTHLHSIKLSVNWMIYRRCSKSSLFPWSTKSSMFIFSSACNCLNCMQMDLARNCNIVCNASINLLSPVIVVGIRWDWCVLSALDHHSMFVNSHMLHLEWLIVWAVFLQRTNQLTT